MLDDIIVLIYLGRIIVHSGKIAPYSSNSHIELTLEIFGQPRT